MPNLVPDGTLCTHTRLCQCDDWLCECVYGCGWSAKGSGSSTKEGARLVVSVTVAICASLITISHGKCTSEDAMQVVQKSIQVLDQAEAARACTHEAYEQLGIFAKTADQPISIAWSCAALDER